MSPSLTSLSRRRALIRVAIVADNRLLLDGLLRLLGDDPSLEVVGEHELGESARLPADVILLDSRAIGALTLLAELAADRDAVPVILLSGFDDPEWARRMLDAGARGILSLTADAAALRKAIRVVHQGELWVSRRVLALRETEPHAGGAEPPIRADDAADPHLSAREREIIRYVARGLTNRELARTLAISEATVKAHLTRVFQKLGLHRRAELVASYHNLGFDADPALGRTTKVV